jgi:hypothetical protein
MVSVTLINFQLFRFLIRILIIPEHKKTQNNFVDTFSLFSQLCTYFDIR